MKQIVLVLMACGAFITSLAQTDSATKEKIDTIKVGGIIIVKKPGKNSDGRSIEVMGRKRNRYNNNISTNWFIVDLGFANFNDNTNYTSAGAQAFAPGFTADNLDLNVTKSVNVNIWFFMQKLNLAKHVVNLKYGLGLELNNYRFDDKRVRIQENPTLFTLDQNWNNLVKNKLAADYLTLPLMLNFDFTPNKRRGFGLSVGASVGYLYSARQKIKTNDGDKEKFKDDFNLRPIKISYIGELSLGPVRLYGAYATRSMWEKGFDHRPYNVGIRLSNW